MRYMFCTEYHLKWLQMSSYHTSVEKNEIKEPTVQGPLVVFVSWLNIKDHPDK